MIEEIKQELLKLEEERNIKILYAVESGSRAWGFASKDSDWDVRFIYIQNLDWYLSVQEQKDNIEIILPNDIDLAGWEFKKALLLFRKSNPPLLEWLRSPIIYKEDSSTVNSLRKLSDNYFNPKSCLYHYYNMAKGNFEAYFKTPEVRVKKYFYVLRPILACMWIERTNEMAPMEFEILLEEAIKDQNLKGSIKNLLMRKKNGEEMDKGNKIPVIDDFLTARFNYYEEFLRNFHFQNSPQIEELNRLFRSTLNVAWA
jgi:predicted nucleotidyltransferase